MFKLKEENIERRSCPGILKAEIMNKIKGFDGDPNLGVYSACLAEAKSLYSDAKLLFDNSSYKRAYFLGLSALEEISKSQLAADVYTGYIEEDKFKKSYRDHKAKIERVEWIKIDGNDIPMYHLESAPIEIQSFDYIKKLKSLYVDVDFKTGNISIPSKAIDRQDALSVLRAIEVGFNRIYEVTIKEGEQIGTKGFMK